MSKPTFALKFSFAEFISTWDKKGVECPKCHQYVPPDCDPLVLLASDVLCTQCSLCDTYLLIDKRQNDPVFIEGFPSFSAQTARVKALTAMKGQGRPGKGHARQQARQKDRKGFVLSILFYLLLCGAYLYLKLGHKLPESHGGLQIGLYVCLMVFMSFTVYSNGEASGTRRSSAIVAIGLLMASIALLFI